MLDSGLSFAESNSKLVSKKVEMVDDRDMSFSSPMAIINKLNALKQNISGGSSHDKPAELFRKDLISAMKLADSEALRREDYCLISDHWRQDWEKGVQVPVNPNALKHCQVNYIKDNEKLNGPYIFKMPKKLLHAFADETYKQGVHELHETQKLADEVCRYDLDELDVTWLSNYNCLRLQQGDTPLTEYEMERVMEALESRCYDGMQEAMKSGGLVGIEYDENVVCDICRSPDSEDGNEMIFCDACDVCVHQACYGVHKIPTGSWLCRACALGIKPPCVLCPNLGGAMKSTHDGSQWAHLSCALWIPEIAIVDTEKMEPIDKISEIPANRWALICTLCRERTGACIQCSVKKCKTAFHVTCGFQDNLEMKANFDEDSELVLKGYCTKHSRRKDGADGTPKKTPTSTPKKHSEMTEEEKKAEKTQKMQKLAEEFYTYVGELKQLSEVMEVDSDVIDIIYNYWFLKRKCNFNKPLMTPKVEEGDVLLKQREDGMIARLKMFIHLRQDLERVRNLCYMVSRREKLRNQLMDTKRNIFMQQIAILRSHAGRSLGSRDYKSVATAHLQSPSVYDQPEAVIRTARSMEAAMSSHDGVAPLPFLMSTSVSDSDSLCLPKVSRIKGRGRGRPPNSAGNPKNVSAVARPKPTTPASTENPYARPTYKSFAWMISSRRQTSDTAASTSTPASSCESPKRKYRRNLCDATSNAATPNTSTVDVSVCPEETKPEDGNAKTETEANPDEEKCAAVSCRKRRIFPNDEHTTASVEEVLNLCKDDSVQSVMDIGTDEKVVSAVSNVAVVSSSMTPGDSLSSDLNEDAPDVEDSKPDFASCNDVIGQSPESVDVDVDAPCLENGCSPAREPSPSFANGPTHLNGCYSSVSRKEETTPESLRRNATFSDVSKLQTRHFSDVLLAQSPSSVNPNEQSNSVANNEDDIDVVSVGDAAAPSGVELTKLQNKTTATTVNGVSRRKHNDLSSRRLKPGGTRNNPPSKSVDKLLQKTLDGFFSRTTASNNAHLANGFGKTESAMNDGKLVETGSNGNSKLTRRLSMRPARKRLCLRDVRNGTDSDSCDTLSGLDVDGNFLAGDDVSNESWNRRSSLRSSVALVNSR